MANGVWSQAAGKKLSSCHEPFAISSSIPLAEVYHAPSR